MFKEQARQERIPKGRLCALQMLFLYGVSQSSQLPTRQVHPCLYFCDEGTRVCGDILGGKRAFKSPPEHLPPEDPRCLITQIFYFFSQVLVLSTLFFFFKYYCFVKKNVYPYFDQATVSYSNGSNLGFTPPRFSLAGVGRSKSLMRAECVGKTKAQKKHSENARLINYNPPTLPLSPSKSRADFCFGLTPQEKLEPVPSVSTRSRAFSRWLWNE